MYGVSLQHGQLNSFTKREKLFPSVSSYQLPIAPLQISDGSLRGIPQGEGIPLPSPCWDWLKQLLCSLWQLIEFIYAAALLCPKGNDFKTIRTHISRGNIVITLNNKVYNFILASTNTKVHQVRWFSREKHFLPSLKSGVWSPGHTGRRKTDYRKLSLWLPHVLQARVSPPLNTNKKFIRYNYYFCPL